jgi:hypothetical protein
MKRIVFFCHLYILHPIDFVNLLLLCAKIPSGYVWYGPGRNLLFLERCPSMLAVIAVMMVVVVVVVVVCSSFNTVGWARHVLAFQGLYSVLTSSSDRVVFKLYRSGLLHVPAIGTFPRSRKRRASSLRKEGLLVFCKPSPNFLLLGLTLLSLHLSSSWLLKVRAPSGFGPCSYCSWSHGGRVRPCV